MTDEIMMVDVSEWNIPSLNSDLICDILDQFDIGYEVENGFREPNLYQVKSVAEAWWCDENTIVVLYNIPVTYGKSLRGMDPYDYYIVEAINCDRQLTIQTVRRACKLRAFL
jgi:hypothetical protein